MVNAARAGTMPTAVNPRYEPDSESDGGLTGVTAVVGICASIVAVLLLVAFSGHWPALVGALLIACVPPGAAVMCWVDSDFGVIQVGLSLTISLAVTAIATSVMIWLSAWHPKALFAITALSVLSCAVRLWRRGFPATKWTMAVGTEGLWVRLIPLAAGLIAWVYGIRQIQFESISTYGPLASGDIWFLLGLALLFGGGLVELLSRMPRAWLLCLYVAAVITVIYAAAPLLYKAPEYSWVYKHIGIAASFSTYGKLVDPSNIYDQWPALFTTLASISGLAKVSALDFAAWAELAFELADALLVLGIFRMIGVNRRSAYLALFLYEGFIAWIGQDYLSPQAFAYMLWLGIATIILRWLLVPIRDRGYGSERGGLVSRLRARLLAQMPQPLAATPGERGLAFTLVIVLDFAIVAAHQLTPYMTIVQLGTLVILGLVWRGWTLLGLVVILTLGYLLPRYGLISSQYGGLFSSGNAVGNASGAGAQLGTNYGAHAFTSRVVEVLAAALYLPTLVAIVRNRRHLGRVVIQALLGFSPFVIVFGQSYGGEAIYRVFLFSAAWCVILVADALVEISAIAWRKGLVGCAYVIFLVLGLQGNYGTIYYDGVTPQEVTASLWLYDHAPRGSLFVLATENFPTYEAPNYQYFNLQVIPDVPNVPSLAWVTNANVPAIDQWIASLQVKNTYVVFSHMENAYAVYLDDPVGMGQLESDAAHARGWTAVFHNSEDTIYRVQVGN
jgi:hypothetical protein